MVSRKDRPALCPCKETCTPIFNGTIYSSNLKTGDLNEGYSGDCVGQSIPMEYTVGGVKHVNDLNQCIITPLKGIIRFQINKADIESIVTMYKQVLVMLK